MSKRKPAVRIPLERPAEVKKAGRLVTVLLVCVTLLAGMGASMLLLSAGIAVGKKEAFEECSIARRAQ